MRKSDPVAELAAQLVEKLRRLRDGGEYPVVLRSLGEMVEPGVTSDRLGKAGAKKPFADQLLVAFKKDPSSPVSLAEDAERLAAHPLVLAKALAKVCSAKRPRATVGQLQARLPIPLRQPFADVLAHHLASGSLPAGIGCLPGPKGGEWYLPEFLPPRMLLAAKLLQTLAQLQKEGKNYPTTLNDLVEATDAGANPELLKNAVGEKTFKKQTAFALAKSLAGPVALVEDAERLVEHPSLAVAAVTAARTADNQVVTLDAVKKKLVKPLQVPFAEKLATALRTGQLPSGIGSLRIKKKPHLFLLSDLTAPIASHPPAVVPPVAGLDFAHLFEDCFSRLDREHGGHNLVSLVPLRRALGVEKTTFDAGLATLRREGRFVVSAAEGRHGISEEERLAGIVEEGTLLLYVSRRAARRWRAVRHGKTHGTLTPCRSPNQFPSGVK